MRVALIGETLSGLSDVKKTRAGSMQNLQLIPGSEEQLPVNVTVLATLLKFQMAFFYCEHVACSDYRVV